MLKLSIKNLSAFVLLAILFFAGCKKKEDPIPVTVTDSGISSPEGKITRSYESYYYGTNMDETTTPMVVLEDDKFKIYAGFGVSDSLYIVINGSDEDSYETGYQKESYVISKIGSSYNSSLSYSADDGVVVLVDVDYKDKTISGYYTLRMSDANSYSSSAITGKFNKIKFTEKSVKTNTFSYKLNGISKIVSPTVSVGSQMISIDGTGPSGERISIAINGTEEGNYYFTSSTGIATSQASIRIGSTYYYTKNYGSYSGFFQLSEVDIQNKTISGHFAFFVEDDSYNPVSKVVSEGSLHKVSYDVSTAPVEQMSAIVNNSAWSAQSVSAVLSGSYFDVSGVSSIGTKINLHFPSSVIAGNSYSLSSSSYYGTFIENYGYSYSSINYSGQLRIQSYDKSARTISGTYSFTTYYSYYNVTSGTFSVKY